MMSDTNDAFLMICEHRWYTICRRYGQCHPRFAGDDSIGLLYMNNAFLGFANKVDIRAVNLLWINERAIRNIFLSEKILYIFVVPSVSLCTRCKTTSDLILADNGRVIDLLVCVIANHSFESALFTASCSLHGY